MRKSVQLSLVALILTAVLGTLWVNQTTKAVSLISSETFSTPGTLTVGGVATIGGTLEVTGATTLNGALNTTSIGNAFTWETGTAITANKYQIGRDADATNQLHFNVPTGAKMEWSVNDVAAMSLQTNGFLNAHNALAIGKSTTAVVTLDVAGDVLVDSYNVTPSDSGAIGNMFQGIYRVKPTAASDADYRGVAVRLLTGDAQGNMTGTLTGVRGAVRVESNYTHANVNGGLFETEVNVGTATNAAALKTSQIYTGGAITNSYGLLIPAITGGTAPTTAYGAKIDAPGVGGTQWTAAIGTGNSYVAGNLRVGSALAPTEVLDVTGNIKTSGVVNASTAGVRTKNSTANISIPPTDAEIDAIFGTAASAGAGFMGTIDDNGAGTASYFVWSDGTNWWHAAGTKAQ